MGSASPLTRCMLLEFPSSTLVLSRGETLRLSNTWKRTHQVRHPFRTVLTYRSTSSSFSVLRENAHSTDVASLLVPPPVYPLPLFQPSCLSLVLYFVGHGGDQKNPVLTAHRSFSAWKLPVPVSEGAEVSGEGHPKDEVTRETCCWMNTTGRISLSLE